MRLRLKNKQARSLWLHSQGLSRTPTGPLKLDTLIKNLGFVQLDTIRNVTRAHHHILWSRNQNYREPMLWDLLANKRRLFEHFTHDAALIHMDFYPLWTRQFSRLREKMTGSNYAGSDLSPREHYKIKHRIALEGPLCTRAFDTKIQGRKDMWKRPPHKKALDYMWYCGELTTAYRENFTKFYDLTHRVIPQDILNKTIADKDQIDGLCHAALDRMSFGTESEIQKFWDACSRSEVKAWAAQEPSLIPVEIETYDGAWRDALAPANIEDRLSNLKTPTSRLRIINPFDPAIRDRKRFKLLFGIDYKIEIFVPAAKRKYGYYVYPILEGDAFIGRIDLKANRKQGVLSVHGLWRESKTQWTDARALKLEAELTRLARFIGVEDVLWLCPYPKVRL